MCNEFFFFVRFTQSDRDKEGLAWWIGFTKCMATELH